MPIDALRFHLKGDFDLEDLMRRLLNFLGEHADLAYSQAELESALVCADTTESRERVSRALDELFYLDAIDTRTVSGVDYYAFLHNLDGLN